MCDNCLLDCTISKQIACLCSRVTLILELSDHSTIYKGFWVTDLLFESFVYVKLINHSEVAFPIPLYRVLVHIFLALSATTSPISNNDSRLSTTAAGCFRPMDTSQNRIVSRRAYTANGSCSSSLGLSVICLLYPFIAASTRTSLPREAATAKRNPSGNKRGPMPAQAQCIYR
jgi:hypothetical protein